MFCFKLGRRQKSYDALPFQNQAALVGFFNRKLDDFFVADGGFGTGVAGGQKRGPAVLQAVQASDFDTRAAQPAAVHAARQPIQVPLEILSKPTPIYTDAARTLKIEGEVLLDVEFTAMGEIRVLKVVRGLGHGLDESATRAVQAMRFRPAQRNGEPVDIRMTVNIVFRLA